MVKKLLLTFFLVLVQTVVFSATNTYTGANGDWNTATNWSTGAVPTAADDVVIPTAKTVNISANSFAKTVSISGTLKINDATRLTVSGDFTVNSGGTFLMPTGSGLAELAVYGNYINNGLTDFWKSTVVIAGDLLSPQTSTLQKQGNVVVGGNIIGVFDTTGGNGTGQIYAVAPNATVVITPITIDSYVNPGTFPSGETPTLIGLVNLVIYGGSCSFTINDIANVSGCSESNAIFTVSTDGSSPIYQWQVNASGSGWVDLTNSALYSGVSTASLTITGVTNSMDSYKYRAKITSASCSKSGNYGVLTVNPLPTITTQPITQLDCEGASVNFTAVATGTGLTYTWQRKKPTDVSFITIPVEGNVSYPSAGKIKIDNVGSFQSPSGTQYQVVVTNSNGCGVTSSAATLLVNEIIGVTGSSTITKCYGTDYSYAVTTSTPSPGYVVSYQWKSSVTSGVWNNVVDGIHFSGSTTATLNILNGTPTESAEYRVYVVFRSSGADCNVNSSSRSRTITFLPQLAAPEVSLTQSTCTISTGTIIVTVQNIGETYSFDNGFTFQAENSKSGLAAGSYDVIIKSAGGCNSPATTATISPFVTKTWNGSWSPAGAPTSNDLVIINADYSTSSNGDLNACSLIINSGSKLTVEEGKIVVIQNDLTVNGTLDVLDKGSLVMVNDSGIVTNSGTTNIHRFTTPFKKYDYTYWSTPVVSTNIASTFLGWNTGYSYEYLPANFLDANNDGLDDDGNDWSFASTMTPGKGYIVMVPTPIASGPFANNPSEVVFSGKVNNGIQKITSVLADSSYLIGNPYPSALDADAFLDYNSGVLDGTLYFWTHNTAIQAANPDNTSLGTGTFAFTSDDYASYNAVGGVGVGFGTAASIGGTIPNGKIASGQGFFALSKVAISGTNEIVFNNSMRLSSGGAVLDNSQFFKTRNPKGKVASSIEKNRIWLNMTNTKGAFKQTLVGYVTNATNEYDSRFDGVSFDGNEFVDFYSINQDKNLTIQGRALPFDENDQVPLGYRTTINGTFSINIGQVDGVLANQSVFLEDKLTNTVFNLKNGNYTFETEAGTFDDRFVLKYKPSDKTLSVDEMDASDGIVVLYSNNHKTLIIRNNVEDAVVNSVTLFNMSGQKISCWDIKEGEQANIQIPMNNINSEIYIVKVKTTKGETSKKIVIKQ